MPKHIWSKVSSPTNFLNPHPVGSGPYDQIAKFSSQDYVLVKNPHYWMAGSPKIPCIEYVQAASNDAALADIQSGQVDLTHNFVPNVETAYEAKDPQHFHAFYATTAFAQSLVFDDTKYPYSIPAFRKAVEPLRSTGARSPSSVSTATRRPPMPSASPASSRTGTRRL